MGLSTRFIPLFLALALCASCNLTAKLNRQAYVEYHDASWDALAEFCLEQEETNLHPLANLSAPRLVEQSGIPPLYRRIGEASRASGGSWQALVTRSEITVAFIAELLGVLGSRDVISIETLAPQIEDFGTKQEQAQQAWEKDMARLDGALAELSQAWDILLPEHGFSFDLKQAVDELRIERQGPPHPVREDALRHYHDNEYARLAMTYLGYKPPGELPNPKSHIPQDCESLAASLNRLEAALLLRYSLDLAIEKDVDRVQELARVDLSQTPWEDIKVPRGKYAESLVSASIARLKLLKQVDAMLTSCLDVLVDDVDREWEKVWPGNTLETNIFSFAGLPRR